MVYCSKCGTQLSDGAKFCPKCGNPLDGINTEDVGNDNIDDLADTPKSSYGKHLLVGVIALLLIGGGWYGYQSYSEKGDGLVTDSAQVVEGATPNDTEKDNQLIREWYQLVLNGLPSESDMDKYLAPNVKKELWTDDYDGGCYEFWRFRTTAQDSKPDADVSKIENIASIGDGWYEVKYLDMGWKGTTKVKIKDGKIVGFKADTTWNSWDNGSEPSETVDTNNQQEFNAKAMSLVNEIQQIMVEMNNVYNQYVRVASSSGSDQNLGVNAVATLSDLRLKGDRIFRELISLARNAGKSDELNAFRQEMEDFDKKAQQMERTITQDMYSY